ncbi:hypothetical protein GUJ93_ZPchr0011g27797 [Zizania palustris]|uniref:Uncharacterized protein n=1 Tax=Zizania palustris TaxID=103762 RepID=A0A8J5WJJ8_ZIZPA|nr:hypothetical protein GUJ93_ZPchr0011g27797 [Zizania palustris]
MVIADLGCASTPNTLLFVSEAITTVCENTSNDSTVEESSMEVQFFLNDLPSNDFNYIFLSLEKSKQSIAQDCAHRGLQPPPHYVAGVSGSFYARLRSSHATACISSIPRSASCGSPR